MTHLEIKAQLGRLISKEREATNEILAVINLALDERSYLEFGFPTMFEWLVKGFGYSNPAASRRIEAAKLLRAVPEVKDKLESGQVNLSTLCKAQSILKAQEKATGMKIDSEVKKEIIQKIENKSTDQTAQILLEQFPEAASEVTQPRRKVIDANTIRYSLNFTNEQAEDLKRTKEVLSHKLPHANDADILAYALKYLLKHEDPLQKNKSAAEAKRVTKAQIKRETIQSSNGCCTFKDPRTGQVCGTRYQVQRDHIIPQALGGDDSPENLRPLCRKHNILMAERAFGKKKMDQYRSSRT